MYFWDFLGDSFWTFLDQGCKAEAIQGIDRVKTMCCPRVDCTTHYSGIVTVVVTVVLSIPHLPFFFARCQDSKEVKM